MPEPTDDLPAGLSHPTRRALTRAGYTQLDQLTRVRESDLYRLHGMGAKAIGQLRVALAARGQGLAEEDDGWAPNKGIEWTASALD